MAGQNQTRTIRIRVVTDDKSLKAITQELNKLNKQTQSMAGTFSLAKKAFAAFAAVQGVRGLMDMSDTIQQLRDRIKVLTGSSEAAADVFNRLGRASQETKLGVGQLATIYARLAASTKETGISTNGLIKLTTTLANTFRLSGSTAAEATAVAIQLSQGFASGELRGQELRSVLEQNVVAGELLSKEFKVTRGELYKLAEQGMLNATRVMKAFLREGDAINKQAGELSQTFGQTLTLAFDQVAIKLEQLNRKFGLSEKFAAAIGFLVDNAEGLVSILTKLLGLQVGLILGSWVTKMLAFAAATSAAGGALGLLTTGLARLNPWVTASVIAIQLLISFWDDIAGLFTDTIVPAFNRVIAVLSELLYVFNAVPQIIKIAYLDIKSLFTGSTEEAQEATKAMNNYLDAFGKLKTITATPLAVSNQGRGPLANNQFNAIDDIVNPVQAFQMEGTRFGGALKSNQKPNSDKEKEFLRLNNAYRAGTMSLMEYAQALDNVESRTAAAKFIEGSITEFEKRAKQSEITLRKLNREFSAGGISQKEYASAIDNVKLAELNDNLQLGVLTLRDYNEELLKLNNNDNIMQGLTVGTQNYLQGIGTIAEQVANSTQTVFGSLETSMTDFLRRGTQDWRDFADTVLEEIARIFVRSQIIRPIAMGLESIFANGFGSYAGGGGAAPAMGSTVGNRVIPFASGGIVSGRTGFNFGGGKSGVMGEAGPEAILPLSRGSNGDLGVAASITPVNINIINNTGANVETRETTDSTGGRSIEVLIQGTVAQGIANGSFDRVLSSNYGLKRRGV